MSTPASARVPPEVAAAALACLPGITPARLRRLVTHFGEPVAALDAVRSGRAEAALLDAVRSGRAEAALLDAAGAPRTEALRRLAREWRRAVAPDSVARTLRRRGTRVWLDGRPGYPIADEVPGRPAVLLGEGAAPEALTRPRVAVVGTRAATPHGLADARELAAHLAEAGVTVVSGLAVGIDAAAHEGALEAGGLTVGVVATGLDVVYPRRHVLLDRRVRASGLVVGETGFGVGPTPSRFPVRNRIIAALADVVVVVEATRRGGARITAGFGLDYGRSVMAVPGSRRNAAAEGTNALIADGAHPLLDWSDVVLALGLTPGARRAAPARAEPVGDAAAVLAALGGEPGTPDQVASRTALPGERVAAAIVELERTGWIERSRGACWPR